MDDLLYPWFNIQDQQTFDFDSDNMFFNSIHHQLSPTATNWANQADLVCNNGFHEIKNVKSTEPLLSGTNSSTNDASDVISTILSDCKSTNLWPNNIVAGNNNASGVCSGDSITDDGIVSRSLQQINQYISSDPQTVAARERREKISERIRVLQKLVPGGNKMDTASMLDEAANYLKFLRSQVKSLEQVDLNSTTINASGTIPIMPHASMIVPFTQTSFSMQNHFSSHEHL